MESATTQNRPYRSVLTLLSWSFDIRYVIFYFSFFLSTADLKLMFDF
jgi:hypothetical protein